jgi:hypothetical protein
MRLIRLQTDHDNCLFDNALDDDIIIQPGAKIALQNACIIKKPETIAVQDIDKALTFQISNADGPISVNLNTGLYTESNYDGLLNDIANKMNTALSIGIPLQVGVQWAAVIEDNIVSIKYKRPGGLTLAKMVEKKLVNYSAEVTISAAAGNKIVNGTTNVTDGSQYLYVNAPVVKSCGAAFSAKIKLLGTSQSFVLGLVTKQQESLTSIPLSAFTYAVSVTNGTQIIPIINGVAATPDASVSPVSAGQMYVGVEINQGKARMVVYEQGQQNATVLKSVALDDTVDYYPAITFDSNADTQLDMVKAQLDPYATPTIMFDVPAAIEAAEYMPAYHHLPSGNPWNQSGSALVENYDTVNLGTRATYRSVSSGGWSHWWEQTGSTTFNVFFTQPIASSVANTTATIDAVTGIISFDGQDLTYTATNTLTSVASSTLRATPPAAGANGNGSIHKLEFASSTIPAFLGYDELSYITGQVKDYAFQAENMFDITDTADSFVVEMLSLELDSYNSIDTPTEKSGGRRSILATVPKTEGDKGTIIYEVNYPTFIDIRNKNPVAIRNIRARILKSDLTPLRITGTATMTLLIDN